MEGFMIKTGFYNKYALSLISFFGPRLVQHNISVCYVHRVTEIEAERLDETREDREAFQKMLRAEIERQAREKRIEIQLPEDRT